MYIHIYTYIILLFLFILMVTRFCQSVMIKLPLSKKLKSRIFKNG